MSKKWTDLFSSFSAALMVYFDFKVCILSPSDLTQVVKKLLMANHRNKFSLYNIGLLFKGSFVKKAVDLYAISPRLTVYLSDQNCSQRYVKGDE